MSTMMRLNRNDGQFIVGWSASIHAAAAAFACAGAVGGITAFAVAQEREPKRSDRAIEVEAAPTPPRFEAFVLDRLDPPPRFRLESWEPWTISDDGIVYGNLDGGDGKTRAFKSSIQGGTEWLLDNEPAKTEVRPIAASTNGVALLFAFTWPQDWAYLPDRSVMPLNNLHPDTFFANDMNNGHLLAGMVGVQPNNRAVIYDDQRGFTFLAGPESSAQAINDAGSVAGHLNSGVGWIDMRVWHADGRISDFTLPRESTTPIGLRGINHSDEVAGTHNRPEASWAGWYWSERTGLIEIPYLHLDENGGRVWIFGISDDGWVFGNEPFRPEGEDRRADYFLWHPDAGFGHLGDLYDWESRFHHVGIDNGNAALNGEGWLTLENELIGDRRDRTIVLVPLE